MKQSRPIPGLLVAACLVIVVAGLRAAADILVPVAFAALLTVLLAPLVRSLRRLRIPAVVGIPLVVLACVAILSLLFTVVGQSLNALVVGAPQYEERFVSLTRDGTHFLHRLGIEFSQDRLVRTLRSDKALSLMGLAVAQLATVLSDLMLVVLLVLFLLVDAVDLPERMQRIFRGTEVDLERLGRISDEVKQYLVLKTYLCLLTGLCVWIILAVTGIDYAPLWALLAVLLGYVPNIGPFIATAPPVLLALLQVGPGRMFIVLALLTTLHGIIGNVLEPQLLGRKLGLSAFTVFLALIVWGWIWGPAGMLLSVPLMVIIKILLENSPRYGFLAQLLDSSGASMLDIASPSSGAEAEAPHKPE